MSVLIMSIPKMSTSIQCLNTLISICTKVGNMQKLSDMNNICVNRESPWYWLPNKGY